jgi:hypothetical protein
VCTEAVAVVRAVVADFFLDRWHVEIASAHTMGRPRSDVGLSTFRQENRFSTLDVEAVPQIGCHKSISVSGLFCKVRVCC